MTAGCYARKSPDAENRGRDADAKSVTRQVTRAREYAAKRGWRLDDRFIFSDDDVSGAEFKKRPGLTALVEALKEPAFQVLIVSEQSRLGRDTVRTLALIQGIEDAGVEVWGYLDDKRITLAEDTDEVESFIRSWASSQERRKASQRTRDAMRRLAERGRSVGGKTYGYDRSGAVVPSEAEVVRRIFKRRAEGAGFWTVARELERDGVQAPRGGRSWSQVQVANVTRQETYVGVRVWGRTRQTRRGGTAKTVKCPDAVVRTQVPTMRIVDDQLWRRVQEVNRRAAERCWRDAEGRLLSRPTEAKQLLAPFLACGLCGGSLYVRRSNGRAFYCCTRYHVGGKARCRNARGLPVDVADHLGHRNIQNTRIYAQISHPLREQVFRDLERHPKIVRIA